MPDESATPPPPDVPSRGARRGRGLWPIALGLLGALVGILGYVTFAEPSTSDEREAGGGGRAGSTTTTLGPARSVEVYKTILPSLVDIRTRPGDAAGDRAFGSGVIVNADGQILTAHHVVDGASAIEVTFADGTERAAEITSTDPGNDIAVLQTDRLPEVIVPAVLGGGARSRSVTTRTRSGTRSGSPARSPPASSPVSIAPSRSRTASGSSTG